jgi:hypothetical protein
MDNGQITSWTGLAGAAVGGYLEAAKAAEVGSAANELGVSTEVVENGFANGSVWTEGLDSVSTMETAVNYVSPWVQLAETSVRNNGKLTPGDWASAVGSTLSTAVNSSGMGKNDVGKASLRLVGNAMVAGGLSALGHDAAAMDYMQSSVGNEVGQFIGNGIVKGPGYIYNEWNRSQAPAATSPDYPAYEPGPFTDGPSIPDYPSYEPGPFTDAEANFSERRFHYAPPEYTEENRFLEPGRYTPPKYSGGNGGGRKSGATGYGPEIVELRARALEIGSTHLNVPSLENLTLRDSSSSFGMYDQDLEDPESS